MQTTNADTLKKTSKLGYRNRISCLHIPPPTLLPPQAPLPSPAGTGVTTLECIGLTCSFPSAFCGDGASVPSRPSCPGCSVAASASTGLSNPRQRRQPSKSIRACMQPHSVTFCSSHGNPTGWFVSFQSPGTSTGKRIDKNRARGEGEEYLGQEIVAPGSQGFMPVTL